MSFVLGIYDLASYLVPGLLYLFFFNEFLQLFNLEFTIPTNLPGSVLVIGLGVAAYVVGLLFLTALDQAWFLKHWPGSEEGLDRIKRRNPGLKIEYQPQDWRLIYTVLRERIGSNTALEHGERFNAFCMMLRNLIGALILGVLFQISKLIVVGYDPSSLVTIFILVLMIIIANRGNKYDWDLVIERLYGHALAFGDDIESFLANDQPKWTPGIREKRTKE